MLSLFFSISFLYAADCNFYETRYAIPTYGLIVMFAGFGLYFISEKISSFTKKPQLSKSLLLIAAVLSLLIFWYFNEYRNHLFDAIHSDYMYGEIMSINDFPRLINIVKNIPRQNSYFFVVHQNEENILKFFDYKSIALGNLESHDENLKEGKLPVNETENNYFLESWYCPILTDLKNSCEFVKENYKLKLIKQTEDNNLFIFIKI